MKQFLYKISISLILFLVLNYVLQPIIDVTPQNYKELQEKIGEEKKELLFVGTSHFRSGLDKNLLSNHTNNYLNIASSSQSPIYSYFLVQEVLSKWQPNIIVMDIYHDMYWEKEDKMYETNIFYLDKFRFDYLKSADSPFYKLIKTIFPLYDNRPLNLLNLFRRWNTPSPSTTTFGFNPTDKKIDIKKLSESKFTYTDYSIENISKLRVDYLNKLIHFCKKKKIELVFITTPLPKKSRESIKNLNKINAFFNKIATDNQITYLDYTSPLISNSLELNEEEDFSDYNHLNSEGAKKLTRDLINKLKNIWTIN